MSNTKFRKNPIEPQYICQNALCHQRFNTLPYNEIQLCINQGHSVLSSQDFFNIMIEQKEELEKRIRYQVRDVKRQINEYNTLIDNTINSLLENQKYFNFNMNSVLDSMEKIQDINNRKIKNILEDQELYEQSLKRSFNPDNFKVDYFYLNSFAFVDRHVFVLQKHLDNNLIRNIKPTIDAVLLQFSKYQESCEKYLTKYYNDSSKDLNQIVLPPFNSMDKKEIKSYEDKETECERAVRVTQELWKRLYQKVKDRKLDKIKNKFILTQEQICQRIKQSPSILRNLAQKMEDNSFKKMIQEKDDLEYENQYKEDQIFRIQKRRMYMKDPQHLREMEYITPLGVEQKKFYFLKWDNRQEDESIIIRQEEYQARETFGNKFMTPDYYLLAVVNDDQAQKDSDPVRMKIKGQMLTNKMEWVEMQGTFPYQGLRGLLFKNVFVYNNRPFFKNVGDFIVRTSKKSLGYIHLQSHFCSSDFGKNDYTFSKRFIKYVPLENLKQLVLTFFHQPRNHYDKLYNLIIERIPQLENFMINILMKEHENNQEEHEKVRLAVTYIPILKNLKKLQYFNIAISFDQFSPGFEILTWEDLGIIKSFLVEMRERIISLGIFVNTIPAILNTYEEKIAFGQEILDILSSQVFPILKQLCLAFLYEEIFYTNQTYLFPLELKKENQRNQIFNLITYNCQHLKFLETGMPIYPIYNISPLNYKIKRVLAVIMTKFRIFKGRQDILIQLASDFLINLDSLLKEIRTDRKYFDTSDIMEAYRKLYLFFRKRQRQREFDAINNPNLRQNLDYY